jgi:deazaflavin-dependent oxidoreductase (nitroreductase family)
VAKPLHDRYASLDVCDFTTTGRRTGRAHTIEIWFAVHDGTLYLTAGTGEGCDWLRNAANKPEVEVSFGGERWAGRARRVTDVAERELVGRLMAAKYSDFDGDVDIGLTQHAWRWEVPALAVGEWRPLS